MQGCVAEQAVLLANTTSALHELQIEYGAVKKVLHDNLYLMKTADRTAVLELEKKCDLFVTELELDWNADKDIVLTNAAYYYASGKEIYLQGAKIIKPYLKDLSPVDIYYLRKFQTDAQVVEKLYKKFNADPTTFNRYKLVSSGIEFATLALRVGMVVM